MIIPKPQTIEDRQTEHGDDDYDHDHVEQFEPIDNFTIADFHENVTESTTHEFEDEGHYTKGKNENATALIRCVDN